MFENIEMDREDRLQLMRFACTFAWADLEIRDDEMRSIDRLVGALGLDDDRDRVADWLASPPPPEEVDPTQVSPAHRGLLLKTARAVFDSDGELDPKEQEQFELLEQLLI